MKNTIDLGALCAAIMPAIGRIGHEIWLKSGDASSLQVSEKSAGDIATQIDCWAQQQLSIVLLQALPGSLFLGEETAQQDVAQQVASRQAAGDQTCNTPTWIVDPIDGTANFVRGYPQWCVSVGLIVGGEPVLGVIHDPNREESFYAVRGQGAWLQSRRGLQRLLCSQTSELIQATVCTVFPKPRSALVPQYLQEFKRILPQVAQLRRSGSMALELAYIAAGRADALWERGMGAWDIAAAWVILQEAGAQVVALDGHSVLQSQFLMAGAPTILSKLQPLLTSAGHENGNF
ncbi:MAG: inositol monophosphatase [Brachymonas sp.]|nr:inositol monophosphatase [Brachymonas sp.]